MKKTFLKKILCIFLSFICVFSLFFVSSFADELDDKKEDLDLIQKKIMEYQEQIAANNKRIAALTKEITDLEVKINATQEEINDLEKSIDALKDKILIKLDELYEKEKQIDKQNKDLNARLRAMYKNGNAGVLSVILSSSTISKLINNLEMANRIYESDNELLDQMHKEYDAIYAVKLELTGLKNELLASEDALELEMNSLKLQQAEADTKRASLVSDTNTMKEKETQMENEAKMLAEVIRMLQKDGEYAGGNMCWPSGMSQIITSPYGRRYIFGGYSFHYGIDIGGAPIGAPILAANSGTVISAGYDGPGYGNYLMIDHGGGIVTLYAHASALLVTTGDEVKRGQQIAKIGSTGNSTGPHLHFEIRVNGSTQDPLDTSYDYYVTPGKYFYD